jgi:ketosteroid isomerase-like protein
MSASQGKASVEDNKKLATEFLARFSANDIDGALATMSDDATWWIAGKPDQISAAGSYSKEKIGRLFHNMAGQLKTGLKMKVRSMIGEGERVAVEVESYGELNNGRIYNQEYHMLMTIRDGKISAVREYLDTQHVFSIWFQQ